MSTNLKPGDIVQHPEKGNGVVYDSTPSRVMHRNALGRLSSSNLDGWKRVETVRPGHVQVRVNDLDLSRWEGVFEGGEWNHATRVAIRAANAVAAQRAESTPPAQPDVVEIDEAKMEVAARRALAHEIKRILARLEEEL